MLGKIDSLIMPKPKIPSASRSSNGSEGIEKAAKKWKFSRQIDGLRHCVSLQAALVC